MKYLLTILIGLTLATPASALTIAEWQETVAMYNYEIQQMKQRGDNPFVGVTDKSEILPRLNRYIRERQVREVLPFRVNKAQYQVRREYLMNKMEVENKVRKLPVRRVELR